MFSIIFAEDQQQGSMDFLEINNSA